MNFKDTHGGFAGKSLAQKMRDRTDELFAEWMAYEGPDPDILQGRVEGACEMMAILTSTHPDLQWNSTEARYDDRIRQEQKAMTEEHK